MQLSAAAAGRVLASQTIDVRTQPLPVDNGATMVATEREFRLAGARDGIDTFASLDDALAAAGALSAGSMPGLAVLTWRGGYRIYDVHASSRTYRSTSPHGPLPPITRETGRSSVPFAAGNIRPSAGGSANTPAVVRDRDLVALVDGSRVFVPSTAKSWAGMPVLVDAAPRG
jgi:hypothetical protein